MKIPSLAALTCQEVVEIVKDYLEGEMGAADTALLEQHFHACTWCADYVAQLQLSARALGRLADAPSDSASRARLLAAFRRQRDSS